MPLTVRPFTTYYFMPQDGVVFVDKIVEALDKTLTVAEQNKHPEVYAIAFLFSNTTIIRKFSELLAAGVKLSVILDSSQYSVSMKSIWKPLIAAGADVTLATSTIPAGQGFQLPQPS